MLARVDSAEPGLRPRRSTGRTGDALLLGLSGLAAGATALLLGLIAYEVFRQAWPAMHRFGFHFLVSSSWDPVKGVFGAWQFILGTIVTSFAAVLIAGPLSIAIGLFLSKLAPRSVRGTIGALVELLAAVPSVVLGLWGIFVLGPFVAAHLEPLLKHLGVRGDPSNVGLLPAILILTIMIVPITASISRELFLSVPRELEEAAFALGATRWEVVKGVVLPYARGGLVAAVVLGLGRALGEAIAVTQVIGNSERISHSIFGPGDTLASRVAGQYQGAPTNIQVSSLVYLAAILLVITVIANLLAQGIVRR
jgi:phosphate transport system permease protein